MKKILMLLALQITIFSALIAGCDAGADESPVALQVTGNVREQVGWTEEAIRAMDTIEAVSTNKEGEESTYTGVPITMLLEEAGVQSDVSTLVIVGDDGYEAKVSLADVQACADCIVSFRNKGGFSIVMPGFPGKVQVKGVVEIRAE
jgi:hypothetical protein